MKVEDEMRTQPHKHSELTQPVSGFTQSTVAARPALARDRPRIAVACPDLSGNEFAYVAECLRSNWISALGSFTERFEASFASFCGVRHAVACNNGTSALHLVLSGIGLAPGEEVIVPTLTFIATANAVRYCGATPVFADSEPETMNIDSEQLEQKITKKTRGIIVVHLYGKAANMDPILDIAKRNGLWVIEDAAQAHGAMYRNQRVGSIGRAATFSFFGNKIVTTGEGGMVTTDDGELAARMRLLRAHGMSPVRKYWFPVVGFNYRMTNIEAAIGLAQMERIEAMLKHRRMVAQWYDERLADCSHVVTIPRDETAASHVYWAYPVVLKNRREAQRDALIDALAADGVETRPIFYPLHKMPPYLDESQRLPNAEFLGSTGVLLPMHSLLTEAEVDFVTSRLMAHWSNQEGTSGQGCAPEVKLLPKPSSIS